jgi:hypothetical protein
MVDSRRKPATEYSYDFSPVADHAASDACQHEIGPNVQVGDGGPVPELLDIFVAQVACLPRAERRTAAGLRLPTTRAELEDDLHTAGADPNAAMASAFRHASAPVLRCLRRTSSVPRR